MVMRVMIKSPLIIFLLKWYSTLSNKSLDEGKFVLSSLYEVRSRQYFGGKGLQDIEVITHSFILEIFIKCQLVAGNSSMCWVLCARYSSKQNREIILTCVLYVVCSMLIGKMDNKLYPRARRWRYVLGKIDQNGPHTSSPANPIQMSFSYEDPFLSLYFKSLLSPAIPIFLFFSNSALFSPKLFVFL